jgi:hypothetical protein
MGKHLKTDPFKGIKIFICNALKINYYYFPFFKKINSILYYKSLEYFFSGDPFTPFDYIIWTGGYDYTGDVTDPENEAYLIEQGVKVFDIYEKCIKKHIKKNQIALEIGPGIGSFSKQIIKVCKECYLVDALSLSRNKILDYLENPTNVHYIHAKNFLLDEIPDNSIDFFFSFQTLNFIPMYGVEEYFSNLYKKAKVGFIGFAGISDDRKNGSVKEKFCPGYQTRNNSFISEKYLVNLGFKVIDSDFLKLKKESIIHFRKDSYPLVSEIQESYGG